MIALWIVLGVLLLLSLILLIRVQVFLYYSDELTMEVKILFWRKTLIPSPPKKEKPKKAPKKAKKPSQHPEAKQKQEKKQSYLSKLREKKGISGIVSLLTSLAQLAAGTFKELFSHVVIHRMDVGIALNYGDAASTAVTYGRLCAVVYPAVNIITAATICKSYNVSLEPVFNSEKNTEVTAEVHAHVRMAYLIIEAIKAGVKLVWLRFKI